jgi:hypothetical protein
MTIIGYAVVSGAGNFVGRLFDTKVDAQVYKHRHVYTGYELTLVKVEAVVDDGVVKDVVVLPDEV